MNAEDLLFLTIMSGVLGAAVGSFLNVVVLRTHADQPFWKGRSSCPHCGSSLKWYDLVPLASFVLLGGRCRNCKREIAIQYLLIEATTALAFAAVAVTLGWSWLTLVGFAVVAGMVLIAVFDARWSLIPDEFTIVLAAAALAFVYLNNQRWLDVGIGVVAGGGFFLLQYLLSKKQWVGSGDIFLGAALGLLLGGRMLGLALLIAYLLAGLIAAAMLATRRAGTGSAMPFGPFLVLGAFLAWLWGEQLIQWYLLNVPIP